MRVDYRHLKPYRDYKRDQMLDFRLVVTRAVLIVGFLLIVGVFWYLQIAHGPEYRRQAEENRLRRRIERPVRGIIRDNSGQILVSNRPAFTVYLDRQRTDDSRREIERLAQLVGGDSTPLLNRLEDEHDLPRFLPIPIQNDIGLETAARIGAHRPELPALDVVVEARRFYPLGAAAAHVVGYLSEATVKEVRGTEGMLPGDRVGRVGTEAAYDLDLRGRHGILLEEVNARGRPLKTVATVRPTQHGRPLQLSIDGAMQQDLESAFAGRGGAAVFLDPMTGAIRAIYSGPSFDPNLFSGRLSPEAWLELSGDPRRPLQNRAVAGQYSPGSTFKIIMAIAAAESGAIKPGEKIYCGGAAKFYGQLRHCHRRGGHGYVGLAEALTRSCNVFFYTVGQRMGIDTIEKWSKRLGLGEITGFPAGGEASGLVPSREWKRQARREPWYPGETISVAIGQGPLMVTPIQMALVAAVVANGGTLVTPYLRERSGATRGKQDLELDPEVLEQVRQAMFDVVESERGTARRARIPGVTIAGKTGTAQVVSLSAGKDPGDHAWFVGFGPGEDPELAWAVIVEHAGHGGAEAAPIVRKVLEAYLARNERRGPKLIVRRGAL